MQRTPSGQAPTAPRIPLRGRDGARWLFVALAFAATTLNYLDRQSLSVLAPALTTQLKMSNAQYGRVLAAFMLAYTIMNGISGPAIDRLGTKTGYLLTVAWWSLAELLHVFVRGTAGLAVCRFLLGGGEAGNWPAGVKVVAEWFPPEERSLAAGVFNTGSSVGAVLAPPLIVWITLRFGWRAAFGAGGAAGFVWVLLWARVYPRGAGAGLRSARSSAGDPDLHPASDAATAPPAPLRSLLRSRFLWQFTVAKVFFDPVWYFYTFWYPEYLKVGRGYSLRQIGATAWIPFLGAGLGNLVGGAAGGWLVRRSATALAGRKLAATGFMLAMAAGWLIAVDPSNLRSMAFACLAGFGYTAALVNLLALPGDLYPSSSVASIWGLASMGSGFGGMVFSMLTGWMVDRWSFLPAFYFFSLLPLIAAAAVWTMPQTAGRPTQ